jgi:transglutaminase-like putative cysteine protease
MIADGAPDIQRQLRFSITFNNPSSNNLANQKFWLYLPVKESATQRLAELNVTTSYKIHSDTVGHTVLELSFDQFPALGQKVVGISLGLLMSPIPRPTNLSGNWLMPERFIEVNDQKIQTLAAELRRPTERETARNIYDWVAKNLVYAGFLANDYGAAYALQHGRGDCTEYACLVTALARACGLPARMVGGYVVAQDATPRAEEYHNWAEIYLDKSWQLVDAQKQNWMVPNEQYVAFRYYRNEPTNEIGSAHRFRIDGDLKARM